tara:strand:- start:1179 stop:1784 length:606 start_codon:yes stop_codon:yes gene_type:complete
MGKIIYFHILMTSTIVLPRDEINQSLVHALADGGWKGNWEIDGDSIVIRTKNGNTLREHLKARPLNYDEGLRLAMCLGMQLASLIAFNKSILFFDESDISVIDDEWYIITSLDRLVPIVAKDTVMLTRPIAFKGAVPPELQTVTSLPVKTNISSAYYSVGKVTLHSLGIGDSLDSLEGSSLFFFLERCLQTDPLKRYFLFI